MTEAIIQKELSRRFYRHKYELCNSFIFGGWESDFFSVADSGYMYECEIKISRSDFFCDFKKDKHKLFEKLYSGKEWHWKNQGKTQGSEICRYKSATLKRRGAYRERNCLDGVEYDYKTGKYLSNQWQNYYLEYRHEVCYAPATRIMFINLTKTSCPNRFYYAVPEGLIKKEEVPKYAGLLYVSDKRFDAITCIKQAPLLHKRINNIDRVLMDKFYYERNRLQNRVNEFEISNLLP